MHDYLTALVAVRGAASRTQICRALAERGFAVVTDVSTAADAVGEAARVRPAVCLIDLELPGNGLIAIAQIASRLPATTIVALAATESPAQMIEALERGASGYLVKGIGDDELAKSLHAAHAGEPAVARSLVPHLIERMRRGSYRLLELPGLTVTLTPREADVAVLVQAGLRTDEIARRLGLSPVTVRRHISSLAKKTGSPDRKTLAETLDRLGR
jgi:DNA-binding NarL/FixJ family response regulator